MTIRDHIPKGLIVLNMPKHIRTRIERYLDDAIEDGAEERADLARRALAGEHRAWMLVVKALPWYMKQA